MNNQTIDMNVNLILNADSYKVGHKKMMKNGIIALTSVIGARKATKHSSQVVMAGIQYTINQYINIRITAADVDEAAIEIAEQGGIFDRTPWDKIVNEHGGKLPITIRALPEGTVVPVGVPMVSVSAFGEDFLFLASYVETTLQRGVWFPTTVASVARSIKTFLADTMERHAGHRFVDYHLHNFGDRSAHVYEAAVVAGMAHAMLFSGSDSLVTNRYIKRHYNTTKKYLSSVDASEHSCSCSNSDAEKRDDFNMAVKMVRHWEAQVDHFLSTGEGTPITSVVIDTYNDKRFAREYIGTRLRDAIIEIGTTKGGRLVLRPDSGNSVTTPIEIIEILMEKFGYTVNDQGYKVLPSYIGVLQGDGINEDSIREIVALLESKKISIENIAFGMGSKLVDPEGGRDKFSFAMKAVAQQEADGTWTDLFKDPITDVGKRSHKGRVTTYRCNQSGKIIAERVELQEVNPFLEDMMVTMYHNGEIMNFSNFDEVKERANEGI